MKTQIKTASWEKYRNDLAEELKKDGLRAAVEKRCDVIEEETRGANYARGYITELLNEIIDLAEITEQKPCEYIGNGALKKRGKGFVCYNVEWFKKHWRQELDLMGILPKQKEQEETDAGSN